MNVRRIDQILAGFAEGDAISNEAVALRNIFRRWRVESDLFVDSRHLSPNVADQCRPLEEVATSGSDILIHHYAIASPAVEAFLAAPCSARVMIYHNITPAEFYRGFDDRLAARLAEARERLTGVIPRVDALWADSRFNALELETLGARDVKLYPLLFDPGQLDHPPDPAIRQKFAAPLTNILYVGRLAPNKDVESLLEAFAWYHRTLNRQSRLIVVGSERSAWRYFVMLQMLAMELDLPTVYFERYATPEALSAYYDLADVFVTCSRHEGYCLPLVEAMHRGVPVIARRTGGTPEALGVGGVLFEDAEPQELAVLIHRVVSCRPWREEILRSQRQRMAELRARRPDEELRHLLAPWLGP